MTEFILSVENLNVAFHRKTERTLILKDVSFQVARGQVLGIVGQSGSGKSTTAQAICGILPQRSTELSGRIIFEGSTDLLKLTRRVRRLYTSRHLALIPQNAINALNPYSKIGKQFLETLRLHHGRRYGSEKLLSNSLLEQLGFSSDISFLRKYPHQLSGGMRQRVVIALALLSQAEVLIADEPTTALDTINQSRFLSLIGTICRERELTLIYISHNLALVSQLCDEVLVMHEGRVVESGNLTEVFSTPSHPFTKAMVVETSRLINGGARHA